MGLLGHVKKLLGDGHEPSLVERVEVLERQVKNLRLEWEETFDKIDHANRRMAKRARDTSASGEAPSDPPGINPAWPEPLKQKMRRRMGIAGG